MTDQALTTVDPSEVQMSRSTAREIAWDRSVAGGRLAPQNLGEVMAFAQVMCKADLAIPKHLRGNAGACLAVTLQAADWEMSPFALANKTYSVNDRLAYEAQVIAAVVHVRAPIKKRPTYEYSGDGDERQCTIEALVSDGEGGWEPRSYTSPVFKNIHPKNSPLWKTDPDQQLGYYSIRAFARRYCPETVLGLYTPEEASQMRDEPETSGLAGRLSGRTETGLTDAVAAEIDALAEQVNPKGKRGRKGKGSDAEPTMVEIIASEVAAEGLAHTLAEMAAAASEPDSQLTDEKSTDPEEVNREAGEPENPEPPNVSVEENTSGQTQSMSDENLSASPTTEHSGTTDDPDDWVVLENNEGAAPTGIQYLLASDEIGPDGRLPTYQDGEPFSRVGQKGAAELPQYTEHPTIQQLADMDQAAAIEAEPEIRQNPEDRQEPSILDRMRACDEWADIKRINGELVSSSEWKNVFTESDRDDMRRAIWGVVSDLKKRTKDPVDQADDPSAFRIWMATQLGPDGADAVEGTLTVLRHAPRWGRLTADQQSALTQAVQDWAKAQRGG